MLATTPTLKIWSSWKVKRKNEKESIKSNPLRFQRFKSHAETGVIEATDPQLLCRLKPIPPIILTIHLIAGNIVELLNLLLDSNTLRNFGWPERSVDSVLQQVLIQCNLNPCADAALSLSQRLCVNTKILFGYVVDNQPALESLLARCPIDKFLEQVIYRAKHNLNHHSLSEMVKTDRWFG